MTSKAEKLLEQMKRSKSNWRQTDHDKIKHPDFPDLRTTLPRHRDIAKVYVEIAVKLVEQLNELKKKGD